MNLNKVTAEAAIAGALSATAFGLAVGEAHAQPPGPPPPPPHGPLPPAWGPPPPPIWSWGQWVQPAWNPWFNQWGFWLFGFWIPLI